MQPRLDGKGQAVFSLFMEPRGFGALLSVAPGANVPGLDNYLAKARELAKVPLQSLSAQWVDIPQQLHAIAPTARPRLHRLAW